MKFGINRLPGKIAGEPFVTARPDDEIWVGDSSGVEIGTKGFLGNFFRFETSLDDLFDSAEDFVTAAVIESEGGSDGRVTLGFGNQIECFLGDISGKLVDVTEETELGPFLKKFDGEGVEAHAEDVKDFFNFFLVAFPVF